HPQEEGGYIPTDDEEPSAQSSRAWKRKKPNWSKDKDGDGDVDPTDSTLQEYEEQSEVQQESAEDRELDQFAQLKQFLEREKEAKEVDEGWDALAKLHNYILKLASFHKAKGEYKKESLYRGKA